MTRTTDDLRTALNGYADQVGAPDTDATLGAVSRRLDRSRKIRTGLIAASTAVVLALATLIGVSALGQNQSAPTPAELNKTHHTHFPAYAFGYRLTDIVEVPLAWSAGHTSPVHLSTPASPLATPLLVPLCTTRDSDMRDTTPNTTLTVAGIGPQGPITATVYRPKTRIHLPNNPPLKNAIPVRSSKKLILTATTTLTHPRTRMPVAVYTAVAWDQYRIGKAPFTGLPKMPSPARYAHHRSGDPTVLGRLVVHSKAKPTATVTTTITWPKGANVLNLTPLPTTTGRLRIRFDGTALSCAMPPVRLRTTWCQYFDSNLSWLVSGGPADLPRTPVAGTRHTITVEAQDVTGPWRVLLEPMKEPTN